MLKLRHITVGVATALAAAPVVAQEFSLPSGCEAYVTAQMRNCEVQHFFRCEGDAEGIQHRASFDETGMIYLNAINSEAEWVESFSPVSGVEESLVPGAADPASLTDLINDGVDSFDFKITSPQNGETRFVGFDMLTGQTVTIDGVTLDVTEYDITAYGEDGSMRWHGSGNEYISREWRRFLAGRSVYNTADGETLDTDEGPVEFAFPGETGFLTVNPKYGCGAILSRAPARLETKETLDDHL